MLQLFHFNSMRFLILILFFMDIPAVSHTQNFQPVFPGLTGKVLLDSLFDRFRPDTVLPYNMARDTLYAKILAIDDDTLRCIYSGHRLYLDPTQDPTQYVYLNGMANGMNAEHAYPQSKGTAAGNARSDMHHLYPARIAVNEARGSVPYAEIPDTQTEKWFVGTQTLTSIPAQNKDGYSEFRANAFEPRELVKGDIARSIFYINTMYRSQTNAADPNFFEQQRMTLCQWHKQDPADATELRKTWRIARYQDGKPNPFVLDCSLAHRCWCEDVPPACVSGTQSPAAVAVSLNLRAVPNPATGPLQIAADLPFSGVLRGRIFDATGREIRSFEVVNAPAGVFTKTIEWPDLNQNIVFLELRLTGEDKVASQTILVKIR